MLRKVFKMPNKIKITGRSSSITNAFINSIIPEIEPSDEQLEEAFKILNINHEDVRCAYCGDKATEWDHLRPLVKDQRPTGYISELQNLVPSCGKCNQSKGNKYWKTWMMSDAPLSPKFRNVEQLDEKIGRLEMYEKWGNVEPLKMDELVSETDWKEHWDNCSKVHKLMLESQKLADRLSKDITDKFSGMK